MKNKVKRLILHLLDRASRKVSAAYLYMDSITLEDHGFVKPPWDEDRCRRVVSDDGSWGQNHCGRPAAKHPSSVHKQAS
jgi:hypothetical protein